MTVSLLVAALGVALMLEGLLPLLAPLAWRQAFQRLLGLRNGQIRFLGLVAVVLGLLLFLAAS